MTAVLLLLPLTSLWHQIGNVASVVMLVVTVVFGAVAALGREQLKTVRENNDDLVQRVGILEASEARLTAQVAAGDQARTAEHQRYTAELAAKEQENQILRSVITAADHLNKIEDLVTEHHTEAKQWWETVSPHIQAIHELLENPTGSTDDH